MAAKKLVLAYSGGLDTSVAIRWLKDQGWDVIAFTVDLGEKKDLDAVQARALKTGASAAYVADGRLPFLQLFVWPSLQAGAVYEKEYPLATALGRPLIAAMMVEVARREGAQAVAHGCTGKGNDQVRFDVTTAALAPDLQVVAPVREWGMNRDDEIDYATEHGIEVPATTRSPYSTDENLWGRSIEAGVLEDPWAEPPKDVYAWTRDPRASARSRRSRSIAADCSEMTTPSPAHPRPAAASHHPGWSRRWSCERKSQMELIVSRSW